MSTITYGNCLLFHGGGLCPLSNRYLSKLAQAIEGEGVFRQTFMGFFSFECLLNPKEFIKQWNYSLKRKAQNSHGGFYGTNRDVNLTNPNLQKQAIETCRSLEITWIGVAGGDGSCRQVAEISKAFEAKGIHFFIPMPLTIDGIEGGFSLGLWPAVGKAYEILDDLAATNLQTRENGGFSVLFLEVQGRNRDDILANLLQEIVPKGTLGGISLADIDLFVLPTNYYWSSDKLVDAINGSKRRTLVIYSEGAKNLAPDKTSNYIADYITKRVVRKVRTSSVGYLSQMNKMNSFEENLIYDGLIRKSAPAIASCIEYGKSFVLQFDTDFSSPRVKPIDYWAKLNPREGQKPTLESQLEELLKKYIP